MSGYDPKLADTYEKEAQAANDRIAKITAGIGDLQFDADDFDPDKMNFDNLDDDANDDDLDKLLNGTGDGNDDDLLALLGNDDDDHVDFDVNDPQALEKFEQAEKLKAAKKARAAQPAAPAKKAAPQQPAPTPKPTAAAPATKAVAPAVAAKPVPTKAPTAQAPSAAPTAATSAPSVPVKLTKEIREQRMQEYKKIIGELKANIDILNNQITGILRQKAPDAKDQATKVMSIRKQREKDLETIQLAAKACEPVPAYSYIPYTLQTERHIDGIGQDQMRVTVLGISDIQHSGHYFISLGFELGSRLQHDFKKVKGNGFIHYDDSYSFQLVKGVRSLKTMNMKLRKLRLSAILHKAGMLWGSEQIAEGELKLPDLQNRCDTQVTCKLRDSNNQVVGELEVKVELFQPFISPQLVDTIHNLIKVEPQGLPLVGSVENATTPVARPTANAVPAAAAAAANAANAAANAAAAAPAPAASANAPTEADLEKIEDMTSQEIIQASGIKLSPAILDKVDQLQQFVSFDTITWSMEECQTMITKKEFKRGLDAQSAQDRIGELDLKKMTLEAAVGAEKLSFDDYLQLCRDQAPIYQTLATELMALAKWYVSKGHKKLALLNKQHADYYAKCKEITDAEVKTAEENADEDE